MVLPRLAEDVLLEIFDLVSFDALLPCSHVSRQWRQLARHHPTYWKRLAMDDRAMSPGNVALFLQRLNSRHDSASTVAISLRCWTMRSTFRHFLLPALLQHASRLENLTLSVSSPIAAELWSLFALPAPQLHTLHLHVRNYTHQLLAAPAMLQLHEYGQLQVVSFVDVPLPVGLPALTHTVKSVSAFYQYCPPQFQRIVGWAPHAQSLELRTPRGYSDIRPVPPASSAGHHSYARISLSCAQWPSILRALRISRDIPDLTVSLAQPNPDHVVSILPRGLLCMCVRTQRHPRWREGGQAWGVIAVSTPATRIARTFEHLQPAYMVSPAFLDRVVDSDRLVTLVVSICAGFKDMCERKYSFPRLETLCIGLNILPEPPSRWYWGKITCPVLRVLIFQRESDVYPALISRRAIDSFIHLSLDLTTGTLLHVVLRDVRMTGSKARTKGSYVSRIVHRPPAQDWFTSQISPLAQMNVM
ncbi:hypothetical protein AURDEDRAFT_166641 [Auricularia subglabra TFB-10046 SS5]|nr:hypothetical protein AURDEDRAFT_166641 [Auricularia subglabra TFB-10046 SS5]